MLPEKNSQSRQRKSILHATTFISRHHRYGKHTMGRKRHREDATEVSRRTEVYEDLAHLDPSIRLKAAQTLLTQLVPGADADQLNEILRRLIRGLCSGRKAARLGFSVALTGKFLQSPSI